MNRLDEQRYGNDEGGTCHCDWMLGRWRGVMEIRRVDWEELGLQAKQLAID